MRKVCFLIAYISSIVCFFAGCSNLPLLGTPHGSIQIKAFIDGSDTIKIKGNELWYNHHNYDLPGKWQDHFDEPTIINGTEWKPQWDGNTSDRFCDLSPALPKKSLKNIALTKIQGRGNAEIKAKPCKENNYTLSIYLDDNQHGGAVWYKIKVEW
jgi:hypothetical protein